mmetsp:Transcript_22741/g.49267  ORF Transcript_22741/g.49267 Transcript_22741/m.49267 type:complete len:109 (+) Transcript_22741:37-363(+)
MSRVAVQRYHGTILLVDPRTEARSTLEYYAVVPNRYGRTAVQPRSCNVAEGGERRRSSSAARSAEVLRARQLSHQLLTYEISRKSRVEWESSPERFERPLSQSLALQL